MSKYPNNIDDSQTLPPATGDDATSVNAVIEATEAIETELGVTPAGVYADVRTRLDILETRINNPLVPAPNVLNPFAISGTGVTIQTGTGDPNVTVAVPPAKAGSLFLRQDGYITENLYVFGNDSNWYPVNIDLQGVTQQSVWHLDNTSGLDTNDGLTAATAIKTAAELSRRLGQRPYINQTIDIYIHADMDPNDVLLISGQFGPNGFLNYHGVPTVVHSGTLSAVTAFTMEVPY